MAALLEQLSARHDIRVLVPGGVGHGAIADPALALTSPPPRAATRLSVAPRLLLSFARGRPLRADAHSSELRSALRSELRRFEPDVVHVTPGPLASLAPDLAGRPSVLAALDAWHLNTEAAAERAGRIRGVLLRAEARHVRRFEATEYRRFGRVVVVTGSDRDALLALEPRLRVEVVPNGVDASFYAPATATTTPPAGARIVFTGVLDYPPNVAAAEFLAGRVFPRVRAERVDARLDLVGRTPAREVIRLGAAEGVDVIGEVPDVRPWLHQARVFACAMVSGTGIKNKLLEAMAAGVPCVATPLALQGLNVRPGAEVLVGATEQEFAAQILRILDDDDLAARLRLAAREYVLGHHDWQEVGRAYERLYEQVCAESTAGL